MRSLRNKQNNQTAHKKHELKPNNLQDFCRTCLEELKSTSTSTSSSAANYVIRETPELKELLNSYTTLNISEESEDVYPQRMCSKCYHKVQKFQHFRDQALQSVQVLRAIVEKVEQDEALKATNVVATFTKGCADNNFFEVASSEVSADWPLMSVAQNSEAAQADYSDAFTQSIVMKVETEDTVFTFNDNLGNVTVCTNDNAIGANVCVSIPKEAAARLKRKAGDSFSANVECDADEPMCNIGKRAEICTKDLVLTFGNDSDVGASTSKQTAAAKLKQRADGSRPAKFQCTVESCHHIEPKKFMQDHIQRYNAAINKETPENPKQPATLLQTLSKDILKGIAEIKSRIDNVENKVDANTVAVVALQAEQKRNIDVLSTRPVDPKHKDIEMDDDFVELIEDAFPIRNQQTLERFNILFSDPKNVLIFVKYMTDLHIKDSGISDGKKLVRKFVDHFFTRKFMLEINRTGIRRVNRRIWADSPKIPLESYENVLRTFHKCIRVGVPNFGYVGTKKTLWKLCALALQRYKQSADYENKYDDGYITRITDK